MGTSDDFDKFYRPRRELNDRDLEVLAEPRVAVLATTSPSGDPIMAPCWFLYDDGTFYTTGHTTSQRAKNIERTGRARIMVEYPGGYVSAVGDARVITGDNVRAMFDRIGERYLTETGREYFFDAGLPDDAVIAITVTSWTLAGVGESMVAGLMGSGHSFEDVVGWFGPLTPRDR